MKVFQLIIIDLQKDMFCSGGKKTKSNFVYIFFPPRIVQEHIRKSKRIEACRIINVYVQRAACTVCVPGDKFQPVSNFT